MFDLYWNQRPPAVTCHSGVMRNVPSPKIAFSVTFEPDGTVSAGYSTAPKGDARHDELNYARIVADGMAGTRHDSNQELVDPTCSASSWT